MDDALKGFDPRATYSAAAEEYERASRIYWQYLSARTVERLNLQAGESVLDVACGTGPAALAAAERVGAQGRVVGVDYTEGMLAIARRKVRDRGLTQIELIQSDMLALPYGAEFDAVLCVLGIFFVPDMTAAARALWSHVKPGGRLAVTTFGSDVWTPLLGRFLEQASRARPDIELALPWQRTKSPTILQGVLREAGIPVGDVIQEIDRLPFQVDDWPKIVSGSGLRRIADDLGDQAAAVLEDNARWARERSLNALLTSTNYSITTKPC